MKTTEYYAPETLSEALDLLSEHGPQATVLAGGTDVVVDMSMGHLEPESIIYVGNLPLDTLEEKDGFLYIGPTTKIAALTQSPLIAAKASVLAEAAASVGSPLVRNLATVGGNLCKASPAADMASALLALDAEVKLTSRERERLVPLTEFFVGPQQTVREATELLTEIRIPLPEGRRGCRFIKLGRRKAASLSVVNVTAVLDLKNGTCQEAKIALGAVAPTPIRAGKAEALLAGQALTDELIEKAAAAAVEEISPIDDGRATAWYRRRVTGVLVARALARALREAAG